MRDGVNFASSGDDDTSSIPAVSFPSLCSALLSTGPSLRLLLLAAATEQVVLTQRPLRQKKRPPLSSSRRPATVHPSLSPAPCRVFKDTGFTQLLPRALQISNNVKAGQVRRLKHESGEEVHWDAAVMIKPEYRAVNTTVKNLTMPQNLPISKLKICLFNLFHKTTVAGR